MEEQLIIEAYGLRIGIEFNDRAAAEKILAVLPFYSKVVEGAGSPDHVIRLVWNVDGSPEDAVYLDGELVGQRVEGDRLTGLLDTVLRMTIAQHSPTHLFIHAGVVAVNDEALIFPAKSYSGKTTLVAEMLKHGAVYYSDEYAVIDQEGMVHPYPKPLSMRKPGEFIQIDRTVESMGGRQGDKPLPVRAVIITEYEEGAVWEAAALTPGEAVMKLIPHSLAIKINPKFTLQVLKLIANRAIIAESKRGDVSRFARLILNFTNR